MNKDLEYNYRQAKNDKDSNLDMHLQIIYDSKDSYWNYRASMLCMTLKRLSPDLRLKYTIRHAEVLFKNNDLELIIKFMNEVLNKPAYQEFLKTKKSIDVYEEELIKKKRINSLEKSKKQEQSTKKAINFIESFNKKSDIEKSNYILAIDNPEYNYLAISNLNIDFERKRKHLNIILKSADPYWNYKCVKYILRTNQIAPEIKKLLIMQHILVIYNSKDKTIIKELETFLKYKNTYREYIDFNKINVLKRTYNK